MMFQTALRSVENREVLDRLGVAIFEAAVCDSPRLNLPTPANRLERIMRGPATLFQPIKCKRSRIRRHDVRQLFNLEIFRLLFDLHGRGSGDRQKGPGVKDATMRWAANKKKEIERQSTRNRRLVSFE